jgi:lipopolysaccharide transport system permease protein
VSGANSLLRREDEHAETAQDLMNPHSSQPISLDALVRSLWRNRSLIAQLAKRDVIGRYKGSIIGLAWSFFNPLFMLAVYTFVFSMVFESRWGSASGAENRTQFAAVLFVGLIVQGLFADVLNRAPGIILTHVNFVKKVIFPLEILPVVSLGAALFHSLISLLVLVTTSFLLNITVHWTVLCTPVVLLPLVVLTVGLAWILASLGVYIRDVGPTVSITMTVILFLTPIFYPITAVPERYRDWIMANPLTFIVEQAREVLVWGRLPDWRGLGIYLLVALGVAWTGFAWFQKTRKGFADVL